MEGFRTVLVAPGEGSPRRRFFVVVSVAALALASGATLAAARLALPRAELWRWLLPAHAAYLAVFAALVLRRDREGLYIKGDACILRYRLGYARRGAVSVPWRALLKVRLGPTYIALHKLSGRRRTIRLGWASYGKVLEAKGNVEAMCRRAGVPVERAAVAAYADVLEAEAALAAQKAARGQAAGRDGAEADDGDGPENGTISTR